MNAGPSAPALRLSGIKKAFGGTIALADGQLTIESGEIHALLGENGAGKSTLVSIAAGRLAADAGTIERDGRTVTLRDPRAAHRAGIALVPQHDLLVEAASAADNLALLDPSAPLLESRRARVDRARRLAERLELDLGDPDALVRDLPVGTRQRIEIAGALLDDPAILILDEPTAVLSPDEIDALYAALRKRADGGRAVLLITHRLSEVFDAADRLTLLARGKTVKESLVRNTSPDEVAALLLGGAEVVGRHVERPHGISGDGVALQLTGFRFLGDPIDLTLRMGEQLTVLAIDGNGADTFAAAVAGIAPSTGSVAVCGRPVRNADPPAFREAGGAFVPADRRAEGLVLDLSLAENLALGDRRRGFLLRRGDLAREAEAELAHAGVRAASAGALARELSGGNQQKVVLLRELRTNPRLLVAIHPTRGLDIAASATVRERIEAARGDGCAALVVTADPDEAKELNGPIRVMYRGHLSPPFPPDTPLTVLGRFMAGLAA